MIRILVVDDHVDFRLVFAGILEGQPDLEVVSQAGSLAEAGTMLEGVDVALLDRGLPDGEGLELTSALRAVNPGARVFVISSTVEMRHPEDAIEAGADGVIDKLDPPSGCSQRYGEREAARVPRRPIHRSAWKGGSPKSISDILHRPGFGVGEQSLEGTVRTEFWPQDVRSVHRNSPQ